MKGVNEVELFKSLCAHLGVTVVAHELSYFDGVCSCGWDYADAPDYDDDPDLDEVHRRHVSGEEAQHV